MKIFIVLALIAFVSAARLPSAERQVIREWQMSPRSMNDEDKIVGGYQVSSSTAHPFIVSLWKSSHFCGGSIVSSTKILTAAHCTRGQSASSIQVLAGDYRVNYYRQISYASSKNEHWGYNPSTMDYDFSVLTLSSSFSLGDSYVRSISYGSASDEAVGKTALAIGWGATYEGGSTPTYLRAVSVPIISNSECNGKDSYKNQIKSSMLCAGFTSGGKDSCQGDSGGPLVVNGKLVGVVSWGYGCARADTPGVYGRVTYVKSWLP